MCRIIFWRIFSQRNQHALKVSPPSLPPPQILVVIEPLLIDEDYYARVEGREIISNLAKAAGLATMISTMRPDIDNMDEYVRNTTARYVT